MHDDTAHIGRRLREIRSWRQLSLRAAAELSGISHGYLAKLERGDKAINSRRVLESLANTLRVAPSEITGSLNEPVDATSDELHASIPDVVDVLTGWQVDEAPDARVRPWPEIHADCERLTKVLRPAADLAGQARMLPGLIRELLTAANDPAHQRAALTDLLGAYKASAYLAHDLGVSGLPTLAVERMRQVAERMDDPVWTTYAGYHRAQLLSGGNRRRQYDLAVGIADAPDARVETRGMAHLTAALSRAVQGDEDTAQTHLSEAAALAGQLEPDVSPWQQTNFGRTNVSIWRTTIAVELGHGGKVEEIASTVRPVGVSTSRQAAFWLDYGRGLLAEPRQRTRGVAALLKAEQLAPQKVRTNVFAREAVADNLRRARRDAGGRDLRGLAWRMGVAPNG
ncbi:hypothetical protein GCM10009676_12930 [Prauserella halophila]|uniref:HTH cro/C1-type domain-containing protein n=1 Tax=Prauserella halophila TaxID=185641 RepID=A0ABP4GNK9_9PSEU|nr:helix-turn-helix transcriptional regulator [Prauserella halophila]MCP2236489.1 Transcriptional regulator, contains XRE-family HTH domain [Prauserella halophila]